MSLYNDIVRRPHLPRERAIRRIMLDTGIDLFFYGRSSEEDLGEVAVEEPTVPTGEEGEAGECEEEEEPEADPCV